MKKFFTGFSLFILMLPSMLLGWSPVPDDVWRGEADLQYQYQLTGLNPVSVPRQKYSAYIYYGKNNNNNSRQLHKPVILLGRYKFGFDKHFRVSDFYEAINTTQPDSYHIFDNLRNQMFDVIIVDLDLSVEIQANSYALIKLIEDVKSKTADQITIIGLEIGGLISRYALTYMEKNNQDHRVGLHITSDTPHQGLNIPYGLQWYTWAVSQDFANYPWDLGLMAQHGFSLNPLKTVFSDFENYKSLKQMMIVDYISTKQYNENRPAGQKAMVCHPLRKQFLTDLINLGDYPKQTKNIAVSSGIQSSTPPDAAPIFSHSYDHWGEFDWWVEWDGFHYIADPLRLRMSSYISPLNVNSFEKSIYTNSINNGSHSTSYKPDGFHTNSTSHYAVSGVVKSSDNQYYHIAKETTESCSEYGDLHKGQDQSYPYYAIKNTSLRIVKFKQGLAIPICSEDFKVTGKCNDPRYETSQENYDYEDNKQQTRIYNIINDLKCSMSDLPGTITGFVEQAGGGQYVYTYTDNRMLCRAEGNIPNTNQLIAQFGFHHQQPQLHDDEVRWDRIAKIDFENSLYINADDYAVELPTYEYANGTSFTYKDMLTDFLKLGKFWGSIVTIPKQCVGSILGYDIYLSQIDVNIFNEGSSESSMNFYLNRLCYIPTTSALDIRQIGNNYTSENCLTKYTLADKINTVASGNVKSPYDITYNNGNNGIYNSMLKAMVANDIATNILPHNIILSRTSIPTNVTNFKARNNIYMGNNLNIKAGMVTMEAGSEIIIEPGTNIDGVNGLGHDVKMEINPLLKVGGK